MGRLMGLKGATVKVHGFRFVGFIFYNLNVYLLGEKVSCLKVLGMRVNKHLPFPYCTKP